MSEVLVELACAAVEFVLEVVEYSFSDASEKRR